MFKKLKLSTKIIAVNVMIILCFSLVFVWLYPRLKESLYNAKYTQTQNVVNAAYGVIEYYAKESKSGNIPVETAKQLAMQTVKNLRYGKGDYFWINDLYPKMIMHPIKPEMDGQDVSNEADANGKRYFAEFTNVARRDGAGFVEYSWDRDGNNKPVPKVSYVKLLRDWEWVIG